MAEPVDRDGEGRGGLARAEGVFLAGCGLPAGWRGKPCWQILQTGFGLGLNFLATWSAWRHDPDRCARLVFSAVEAVPVAADDIRRGAAPFPGLTDLADRLAHAWRHLTSGLHRLSFEGEQVVLLLHVGQAAQVLREPVARADAVFLDGFHLARHPGTGGDDVLRGVARNSRRGARLAADTCAQPVLDGLAAAGFTVERVPGLPPKHACERLTAVFEPRRPVSSKESAAGRRVFSFNSSFFESSSPTPSRQALVVGAGLSGAAAAWSLAQRGWSVTVLEAGPAAASGASGLPIGLAAPHVTPDDSPLSRLTRTGLRATTDRARALLREGLDWAASGVLERRETQRLRVPGGDIGSQPAPPDRLAQAGLPPDAAALWHPQGLWLRPAALVQAQLAHPRTVCHTNTAVHRLLPPAQAGGDWSALDVSGQTLASAPLVVLAAAWATRGLLAPLGLDLPLAPLRGQVAWGHGDWPGAPPFPVNGHGLFVPGVPGPQGPVWLAGATYERDQPEPLLRPDDHVANAQRLAELLPALAGAVAERFADAGTRHWAGVRATLPDRVPAVGWPDRPRHPGLTVLAGLGSRGLTLSVLAGELLAAAVEGEPLPLAPRLAAALDAGRWQTRPARDGVPNG